MITSRRQAIRLGLCATASLVAAQGLGASVSYAAQQPIVSSDDNGWLRRDLFESAVGDQVVVSGAKISVSLELARVDDQPGARRNGTEGDEHNFVVVFRGPQSPKLTQGTYQVDSRILGSFELFLVPERSAEPGVTYTATFSRLS